MPATTETEGPAKQKSGAQKRADKRQRGEAVSRALSRARLDMPPPPDDDLDLQLWGARCAANLAHVSMLAKDYRLAREALGVLGLLFPRAELVRRAQRELKRRQGQEEAEPLARVAEVEGPMPGSRFRQATPRVRRRTE